jgi:hypothetical protein
MSSWRTARATFERGPGMPDDPFDDVLGVHSDPPETHGRQPLNEAVKTGDLRIQLTAMRDYIAHQLEANLCKTCLNSRLRTGDQASLLLRLEKVIEQIAGLPEESEVVNPIDEIRNRRLRRQADQPDGRELGTKSAERRTGPRRPRS